MREVRRLFRTSTDFAEAWARHLSSEVQRAWLRCEILALRTVAERLDAWLLTEGGALPEKGLWSSVARQIGGEPGGALAGAVAAAAG